MRVLASFFSAIMLLAAGQFAHAQGNCSNGTCDLIGGGGSSGDIGCNGGSGCSDPGCGGGSDSLSYNGRFFTIKELDFGYSVKGRCLPEINVGGWIENGIMTNSHGATRFQGQYGGNGPMHFSGKPRNDVHLDQFYLFAEKPLDTSCGFDWGFRADTMYGTDGPGTQSYADQSFDHDWLTNDHGYGMSLYQLYATAGYKDLTLKAGKFITPIGWEGVASYSNFFYSHSYCYTLEPSTHVGVLADYALCEKLTLSAGWVAGNDNGFRNRYSDDAFLGGLTLHLTEKANVYYWLTVGRTNSGTLPDGTDRLDPTVLYSDYYIQSLVYEWNPTDRFTYICQYNLRNDGAFDGTDTARSSGYGINNHFLYKLNECWKVGLRAEWFRDNGGYIVDDPANYGQLTLGLNWNPNKHWSIRPEVRYDWVMDGAALPYADLTRSSQATAGLGVLFVF